MKRDHEGVLHGELHEAIGRAGHGDLLLFTDAGFAVPEDAWRIDVALTRGIPDVLTVLEVVNRDLWPERVEYATPVDERRPEFASGLADLYDGTGAELTAIDHERLTAYRHEAKAVVRTGEFAPWGNVAVHCGVDPRAWFVEADASMPADVARRHADVYE